MIHALGRSGRAFIQYLKDMKIRSKILLSFIVLSIIPLAVLCLIIYQQSESIIQEKTKDYTTDIIGEISQNIEMEFRDIDRLNYSIITNKELRDSLIQYNRGTQSSFTELSARRRVEEILFEMALDREYIDSIFLISLTGDVFHQTSTGSEIVFSLDASDMERLKGNQGDMIWFKPNEQSRVIPLGSAFNDVQTQQKIGYFVLNFRESLLYSTYSSTKLNDTSTMFIIDQEGRIMSHSNKDMYNKQPADPYLDKIIGPTTNGLFSEVIDGKIQYVTYQSIGQSGWKIVSVIPGAEYEKEITTLRHSVLLIVIIFFLFALLVSYYLSNSISKPIRKLSSTMRSAEKKGFEIYIDYYSRDEIGLLTHNFNLMVKRINYLITRVYQVQLLKQQSELKYLMFQINPHFLFNTLETINWMARIKGVPEVGKITKMLGDLMREGIKGRDFILLEKEIENIEKYITIQQYRYGDKIMVVFDIEDIAKRTMVPKFLLQPLVENAIVHGLESVIDKGTIAITCSVKSDLLVVSVSDNGVGMTEEKLAELRERLKHHQEDGEFGIGINNVHQRIQLHYGEAYGIDIYSKVNEGTKISVVFPIEK